MDSSSRTTALLAWAKAGPPHAASTSLQAASVEPAAAERAAAIVGSDSGGAACALDGALSPPPFRFRPQAALLTSRRAARARRAARNERAPAPMGAGALRGRPGAQR